MMTLNHDVHDEAGSGRSVVLLHSTVCDRRMWQPQISPLTTAGFRLVCPDFRGYGDTPVPDESWNDAKDVADLLDTLGIQETAMIAASGGGRVALEFAARWPSRVTELVLLNTALAGHEPSKELRAFGEREDVLLEAGDVAGATELNVQTWLGPEADEATRAKVREMQRHAFEVQLAAADDVGPIRVETDLAAITARTLVITGAYDLPDFREIGAALAENLLHAKLVELDWAGHLPSLERPEWLDPILINFLG
jgi:3-oxoadipate enol-lactonase